VRFHCKVTSDTALLTAGSDVEVDVQYHIAKIIPDNHLAIAGLNKTINFNAISPPQQDVVTLKAPETVHEIGSFPLRNEMAPQESDDDDLYANAMKRPEIDAATIPLPASPSLVSPQLPSSKNLQAMASLGLQPEDDSVAKHQRAVGKDGQPSDAALNLKARAMEASQDGIPALKKDLVNRIQGMYRILDLHSEQSSGGLGMYH
jgi:hypothetical protein